MDGNSESEIGDTEAVWRSTRVIRAHGPVPPSFSRGGEASHGVAGMAGSSEYLAVA